MMTSMNLDVNDDEIMKLGKKKGHAHPLSSWDQHEHVQRCSGDIAADLETF